MIHNLCLMRDPGCSLNSTGRAGPLVGTWGNRVQNTGGLECQTRGSDITLRRCSHGRSAGRGVADSGCIVQRPAQGSAGGGMGRKDLRPLKIKELAQAVAGYIGFSVACN